MERVGSFIWLWALTILPFTAILTFISTLIVCIQVPNEAPKEEKFPQISQLGTGQAYPYFVTGFSLLSIQLALILIGRVQFLFRTQKIINRIIVFVIHLVGFTSTVFILLMAGASISKYPSIHLTGAFGLFGLLSMYCFLHTGLIFYLFINRSNAPNHRSLIWPLWFLGCSLLLVTFFIVWLVTAAGIPEYIAAATPFLYFLGFTPQFWMQTRATQRESILSEYQL